ncbi:putative intron HNH endonuclease [Moumouvirus australiensis]|nr:putative intron HNH endonuclease [Moumouvirus australiensis]AVL94665.2 putative intron HNH endonuclease [Moumouvirus australiensis]
MTVKEIWKSIPIKEIKKDYDISNLGRVRRTKDNKLISLVNRSGYDSILYNVYENKKKHLKSCKIHKLVAKLFVKNTDPNNNNIVNHINGIKTDNRAVNLEWTTYSGNSQHAADTKLSVSIKKAVIKYSLKTGKKIKTYDSVLDASKDTGISDGSICSACSGKKDNAGGFGWKYVEENPNNQSDVDLSKYKQIDGFPNYVINREGKIYSLPYKRFLKYQDHQEGCKMVQLTNLGNRKDYLVHRLVASYFLEREDENHNSIRHIDGDKTNNHIDNLEWCTVGGVIEPEIKTNTPYYNPKTAIKPPKRKASNTSPKDLLTANPKNLSKKQREERKKLLEKQSKISGSKVNSNSKSKETKTTSKNSGSKTNKNSNKSGSKTSRKPKIESVIY